MSWFFWPAVLLYGRVRSSISIKKARRSSPWQIGNILGTSAFTQANNAPIGEGDHAANPSGWYAARLLRLR